MYSEETIRDYLSKLASREPVPGGGSVSALVGAAGAALISKVANFTIGNEKYRSVEKEATDIRRRAEDLRGSFLKLCSEDATVYKKLSDVFKMPRTEERNEKLQLALKAAVDVPLRICKASREAVKLCVSLTGKGNKNLMSDIACAEAILRCAHRTALINVETNLKTIRDDGFVKETRDLLKKTGEKWHDTKN